MALRVKSKFIDWNASYRVRKMVWPSVQQSLVYSRSKIGTFDTPGGGGGRGGAEKGRGSIGAMNGIHCFRNFRASHTSPDKAVIAVMHTAWRRTIEESTPLHLCTCPPGYPVWVLCTPYSDTAIRSTESGVVVSATSSSTISGVAQIIIPMRHACH